MAFHDVRFPTHLSLGAAGGPERRTEIIALGSGREERNSPWAESRRRYDAGYGARHLSELHDLIAFFEARHGRLHAFRWKDPADYNSRKPGVAITAEDQVVGTGDGTQILFQLQKSYASGGAVYTRPITKPVTGSVRVAVAGLEQIVGTDVSVDALTGELTFAPTAIPPSGAVITAGFEFDVPVRFDTDQLTINLSAFEAGEVPHIPVIEVKE